MDPNETATTETPTPMPATIYLNARPVLNAAERDTIVIRWAQENGGLRGDHGVDVAVRWTDEGLAIEIMQDGIGTLYRALVVL